MALTIMVLNYLNDLLFIYQIDHCLFIILESLKMNMKNIKNMSNTFIYFKFEGYKGCISG